MSSFASISHLVGCRQMTTIYASSCLKSSRIKYDLHRRLRQWTLDGPLKFSHRQLNTSSPIIHIPKSNIYRFGDSNKSSPVFKDLEWTVRDGENWAIVGPAGSGKSMVLETLLGYMRISPPPSGGIYPFLYKQDPSKSPLDNISLVSFTARKRAGGGEFYDFTSRYGAVRDEERLTLREALFSEVDNDTGRETLEFLSERLDLTKLLDLPFIVLSNGQTRRARIAKALLGNPSLLLLDEPLTGLDVQHRPKLTDLLLEMHKSAKPRVIMALRSQDPLPDWVTHVALVDGQHLRAQRRDDSTMVHPSLQSSSSEASKGFADPERQELVTMKNVNVRYGDRHVLKDISWTVKEGERWHLQGPNGSGKTTLVSMLTGDHPQSYTQKHLELFRKPRRRQPTSSLQRLIGCSSPEIFAAFPRRLGENALTVRDVIATGFENTFSYRARTPEMNERVDHLLQRIGPSRLGASAEEAERFTERAFAELGPGEQSLVLLMRALVSKAPLLVLDEVFAGMDDRMIQVAMDYLRDEIDPKQAVIFITHWEEEVPWKARKIVLEDGSARIV